VLTSSRGAWFSLACGLLALGMLRTTRSRWTLFAAVAVAIGLCFVLLPRMAFGDRPGYWHVALNEARSHAILGSGAGTFDDYWYAHRPDNVNVRDAHSLYLEMLAELGPAGLLLLVLVLLPPLAAAVAARSNPAAVAAAGGYVAFVVHAGLDWDWEMPATTLAALACAAGLFAAARLPQASSTRSRPLGRPCRPDVLKRVPLELDSPRTRTLDSLAATTTPIANATTCSRSKKPTCLRKYTPNRAMPTTTSAVAILPRGVLYRARHETEAIAPSQAADTAETP